MLDDDRKVWVDFVENGNITTLIEKFETEGENTPELQQTGWQMILDNFKKQSEA